MPSGSPCGCSPDSPGFDEYMFPEGAVAAEYGPAGAWGLAAVLTAGLAVATAARDAARRRRADLIARGICLACGYDLRATPGRCPECGAVPEPARPV